MSQSPSCLTSAECVALAEKLQSVAHTLLAFSIPHTSNISGESLPKPSVCKGMEEVRSFVTGKACSFGMGEVPSFSTDEACSLGRGEVRSFFLPAPAIQLEKELFSKHRVNDFQGLLEEVNLQLIGLVKLMQSVHKDTRFLGYIIASLGTQISHASSLVLRMRTIYNKVLPIQVDKK